MMWEGELVVDDVQDRPSFSRTGKVGAIFRYEISLVSSPGEAYARSQSASAEELAEKGGEGSLHGNHRAAVRGAVKPHVITCSMAGILHLS